MAGYKIHLKVTVKTIAKASGRCEETVRRHIKSGKLDATDLRSIQKWLNERGKFN